MIVTNRQCDCGPWHTAIPVMSPQASSRRGRFCRKGRLASSAASSSVSAAKMSSSSVKSSRSRANSQMLANAWQSRQTERKVPARSIQNCPSRSVRSQWWQTATTVGVRGVADADASEAAGRGPGRAGVDRDRARPRFGGRAFGGGLAFDRVGNICEPLAGGRGWEGAPTVLTWAPAQQRPPQRAPREPLRSCQLSGVFSDSERALSSMRWEMDAHACVRMCTYVETWEHCAGKELSLLILLTCTFVHERRN